MDPDAVGTDHQAGIRQGNVEDAISGPRTSARPRGDGGQRPFPGGERARGQDRGKSDEQWKPETPKASA
jgi:hypothetical protein